MPGQEGPAFTWRLEGLWAAASLLLLFTTHPALNRGALTPSQSQGCQFRETVGQQHGETRDVYGIYSKENLELMCARVDSCVSHTGRCCRLLSCIVNYSGLYGQFGGSPTSRLPVGGESL